MQVITTGESVAVSGRESELWWTINQFVYSDNNDNGNDNDGGNGDIIAQEENSFDHSSYQNNLHNPHNPLLPVDNRFKFNFQGKYKILFVLVVHLKSVFKLVVFAAVID